MDKNNNTLSEVRKTAAQRMWDAENKQRAKSDASNKRTPSSIPVPDKKMKTEGTTGAKPGWMLRQDPVLGNRVKAAQAKQKEFKKLVGTKVPVKPTPTQGVEEEASPMIKPPSNRFDNKKEAFTHAKTHGGKVFRSTYINPNTGDKNITFVVKKEQGVAEGFNFNDKKGRWEWDDGTSHNASNLTPAQKAKVQQWKAANPSKHQGKATPDTRGEHTPHGTGAGPRVMEQSVAEAKDPREYDYEGDMAKSQLRSIIANAQRAHDMLEDDTNMAEWVQSKITLAADYISTVADYMQSQVNEEVELSELNKDTLYSYARKADKDQDNQSSITNKAIKAKDPKTANKAHHKFTMRAAGLDRAETRLNKESKSFHDIRKELDEKHLTPAEKSKREEIAKAMHRENPGMPMAKKMAIATAAAEKSA